MIRLLPTLAVAVLAAGGAASAQPAVSPGVPGARTGSDKSLEQAPKPAPGYLKGAQYPDTYVGLSVPPTPKSREAAEQVDKEAYLRTRKLQTDSAGRARWDLATRDADESAAAVAADFDCALGLDLRPETAPKTLALLTRVRTDAAFITTPTKNRFQHPRPFVTYGGAICTEADRTGLANSWSYPSGHTTMGWSYGLILAELAPDKATDVLARSRAYGESRVVCGVHTVSDVQEGRTNGSALVAALHADPAFRADLDAARAEMATLRARGGQVPAYRQCAVERDASWQTPWLRAKPPEPKPMSPAMVAEAARTKAK